MIVAAADTHAAIWYIHADRRLSVSAKAAIDRAVDAGDHVAVSSISLAEVVYLIERGRIPAGTFVRLISTLDAVGQALTEVSFDRRIAAVLSRVARAEVPDMPDRIIAATAVYLGVPLISRDRRIMTSGIETIW